MPDIMLTAELGRASGTRASRRLRGSGRIPGVLYGHGMEPLSVSVVARELRVALTGEAGTNALLTLQADGESYLTLARVLQRDPVLGTVTHVDFQIVRRDEVISAEVPVTLVGEATEVAHGDGMVEQQLFMLPVRALPAAIPTGIEADVSSLAIGGSIRVADLVLPANVTTELDPEAPVAIGQPPRVQAVAAGEGEEGAETGAEGEAGGTSPGEGSTSAGAEG